MCLCFTHMPKNSRFSHDAASVSLESLTRLNAYLNISKESGKILIHIAVTCCLSHGVIFITGTSPCGRYPGFFHNI